MTITACSIRTALLASSVLVLAGPAFAAEVTPQRLLNADKESQNWLMNHRTYNGQRYSPLGRRLPPSWRLCRLVSLTRPAAPSQRGQPSASW